MASGVGAARLSTRPETPPIARLRRHRAMRRVGIAGVAALVAAGALNLLGVRTATSTAAEDGVALTVTFARITRSGLETPWTVEVRSPGGFAGPVTISTSARYFERFDFNQWYPEPSATVARGDLVELTFDPPDGDVLTVRFDGRASPTLGLVADGETAVSSEGLPDLSVSYRTVVMP
jgi:hypothetical protein